MAKTSKTAGTTHKTVSDKAVCIHCGETCGQGGFKKGDHWFCCAGCETVYELLSGHGLKTYYSLEDKPGLKPDRGFRRDRFAYLDKDDIRDRLLDFNDGQTARITFAIPQIHCSSCVWLLENLYRLHTGVNSSRVDFQKRQASVTFAISQLPLSQLVALLASIGYEPDLNLSQIDRAPQDRSVRSLYARLAIAGFCFGNVMLMSFPRYLGMEGLATTSLSGLFDILKISLSIPVVFYAGLEFFRSAYYGLKQKQINMDVPIALGITILFTRSLYDIIILDGAGYLDSLTALVFLLLVGRLYQRKTYSALAFERDYKTYLPIAVLVKTAEGETSLPLDNIEIGHRLLIRNQEIIPADAKLIAGQGKIDYSFVTGEATPVNVTERERLFAGGRQIGQTIEIEVIKEPSRSYLMQLWEQTSAAIESHPRSVTLANKVSRWFTPIVLLIAAAAAGYWLVVDPALAMNAATAVLIVACPCALALSTPFALGTAQRLMGQARFFLKDSSVVERMAALTRIVFDKTGTITQTGAATPEWNGPDLTEDQKDIIYSLVRQSTHPLSILIAAALSGQKLVFLNDFTEERGQGLAAIVDGKQIKIGSAGWVNFTTNEKTNTAVVYVAFDDTILGYYRLANVYRKGLDEVAKKLRRDYPVALISGDNDAERPHLIQLLGNKAELLFNQSPYDKLDYIHNLTKNGERSAMIGDGLNDAGALKAASVGITVVEKNSGFSPACDGILHADGFARLPNMLALTRDTVGIIKVSFGLSFLYNLLGLFFAVQGTLSPVIAAILMPASSLSVVLFTTLMTTWRAKSREVIV